MKENRTSRRFILSTLTLVALVAGTVLGTARAEAAELGDYRWTQRPLLLFAPTDTDPQLVETLRRIDASHCAFLDRDMVTGIVLTAGISTLDGHAISADESARLFNQYTIGDNTFSALLIGKDGGEKLRVNGVPDLSAIYDVIDGMPMGGRELRANPSQC